MFNRIKMTFKETVLATNLKYRRPWTLFGSFGKNVWTTRVLIWPSERMSTKDDHQRKGHKNSIGEIHSGKNCLCQRQSKSTRHIGDRVIAVIILYVIEYGHRYVIDEIEQRNQPEANQLSGSFTHEILSSRRFQWDDSFDQDVDQCLRRDRRQRIVEVNVQLID